MIFKVSGIGSNSTGAKKKDGLEGVDWQKFYEGVKEFVEDE